MIYSWYYMNPEKKKKKQDSPNILFLLKIFSNNSLIAELIWPSHLYLQGTFCWFLNSFLCHFPHYKHHHWMNLSSNHTAIPLGSGFAAGISIPFVPYSFLAFKILQDVFNSITVGKTFYWFHSELPLGPPSHAPQSSQNDL